MREATKIARAMDLVRQLSDSGEDVDATWLRRLARGDLSALGSIYDRHGRLVYRCALAILGSQADAEDVASTVFLRLARQGRRAARIRDLRRFLVAAARNEAISMLRRRRRQRDALERGAFLEPAPDAQAERDALEGALAALPREQREVVVLKVFEGMTFAEIARLVGVSPNTAASRYRYAVAKMKEMLSDEESV